MKTCLLIVAALSALPMVGATHALASGRTFYGACGGPIGRFFNNASCEAEIASLAGQIAATPHPTICLPRNFQPAKSVPLVERYMEQHPQRAASTEWNIVYFALEQAYPCAHPFG